ncbi:MMPL family transporter [bacterium]|nr:MMPL family transporter [bacterium]
MAFILNALIRFRLAVVCLVLALFFFFLKPFLSFVMHTNNALPVWFSGSSVSMQELDHFYDTFGNNRFLLLAYDTENVFSTQALEFAKSFTQELEQNPHITSIAGFGNMQDFYASEDELIVKTPIDSLPLLYQVKDDLSLSDRIKETYKSYPYYSHRFFSEDTNTMVFYAGLADDVSPESVLSSLNNKVYASGPLVTDEALNKKILHDQILFLPLVFGGIIFLLLIITRSIFETIVLAFMEAFLVVTVIGSYGFLGFTSNVIVSVVIPVLVTVTIANGIHLVLRLHATKDLSFNEAIIYCVQHLAKPSFFTALTTIAGLFSFSPSTIPPLQHMGYLSGLGVLWALFLNLFILPVFLSFGFKNFTAKRHHHFLSAALENLARFLMKHATLVKVFVLVLIFISVLGISKVKVESNFVKYFPSHDSIRTNFEKLDQVLGGIVPLEILIKAPDGKIIAKDPEFLKKLDQQFDDIAKKTGVRVFSVIPVIKKLNGVLGDTESIPDTKEKIAELYLVAESSGENLLSRFKSTAGDELRFEVHSQWVSAEDVQKIVGQIKSILEKDNQLTVTGYGWLWVLLNNNIIKSQLFSLALSLVVVTILMIVLLKSFRFGLVSLIPNLVPLIIGGGIMGFLNYPVDLVTVMIFSLTLGVVVDDTIHYVETYREFLKKGHKHAEAIIKAHGTIGVSITYTAFILTLGFGILCFAGFDPTFRFGLLTALTLFISVIFEIFMGPVVFKNMER